MVACVLLGMGSAPCSAQGELRVAGAFDSISAPSAAPMPGLAGAFRQQVLIGSSRLTTVRSRNLTGIRMRRDIGYPAALRGGEIDVELWLSSCPHEPAKARETFAANRSLDAKLVFRGRITIPDSPEAKVDAPLWGAADTVQVVFASPFAYSGGPLCLDWIGRPVPGKEPRSWYVDHEMGGAGGVVTSFGQTCSSFVNNRGETLMAQPWGLQIGSTMQLIALGDPASKPLVLLGARRHAVGVDLAPMGAPGCTLVVDHIALVPLAYSALTTRSDLGYTNLLLQIPADDALLGSRLFAQLADMEGANKSNPAGLTTSNGLELAIATVRPTLDMAVVVSHHVTSTEPMPQQGRVNVETGPVLRLAWR
ncbi:MAG: hypothetical protein H6837_08340 [Planctomycetes bacterium]|nr:hypothetical protein [Planctomycetota bacterium]